MSADNWEICPQCLHKAESEAARERETVNAMYGTIPVEDFDRRRAQLCDVKREDYRTFREDYECGLNGAQAYVDYRGHCNVCGLKAEIKDAKTIWTAP